MLGWFERNFLNSGVVVREHNLEELIQIGFDEYFLLSQCTEYAVLVKFEFIGVVQYGTSRKLYE